MEKWKRDIACGVCLLVASLIGILYSYSGIRSLELRDVLAHPGVYISLWLGILTILTILMMVRAIMARKYEAQETQKPIFTAMAVYTITVFFMYLVLLPSCGYFLSTTCFLLLTVCAYSLKMKVGTWEKKQFLFNFIKWMVFSVCMAFFTELAFRKGLSVFLPEFDLFG